MKKLVAFVLVTLLLCTTVALAEGWGDGKSPSKPYPTLPEVDLDLQFGYMMLYPQANFAAEYACQRLYVYVPREDVVVGEGTLYLRAENGDLILETAMTNADVVRQRTITPEELVGLIWGGGTCFEIRVPKSLTLGATYFVNMESGCLVTEGGVKSTQIGGTDQWRFTVTGDFGVSNMEYRRPLENGKYEKEIVAPQAGDEIRFDLVLGGEAAYAALYSNTESVDFPTATYTESGEIIGSVMDDSPDWGVIFLDAQGNVLDQVEFW